LGHSAHGPILRFSNGKTFPNVCRFYEEELSQLPRRQGAAYYFAYVHGDLNGANIIVDGHENVWLIDFFFTHRGHVLRDLVKLENDLLYIMTVIENEAEFDEALHLSDALMQVEDLGRSMPDASEIGLSKPKLLRTYETLAYLHSFYPDLIQTDRDPLQLFIAQMRYAMHTLGFDESNERQKKWALYTGALCSAQIIERLHRIGPLHIGWIDRAYTFDGRLGITILPGRKDHARDLASDIAALREQGVTHVVVLLPPEELADYGVPDLLRTYADAGFTVYHLPICDQGTCSLDEMRQLVGWLTHNLQNGAAILVHCVGGLGRSGMAVASYLRSRGLSAEAATQAVRDARSPRAIESAAQEEFVRRFG
jgi:protein-tyrosine phosphatase